jgi:ribosomal protein S18 acetylase RimI-like enzyme
VQYSFELSSGRSDPDTAFIWDQLSRYNLQFAEPDRHKFLNILVKDPSGQLVAGLLGETFWRWLYINILWVHEDHRHAGLGSQLVARAEAEAIRRGCRHAYLDTLNFQAPGFYRKLGYTNWGTLDDFPPGHQRIFLKKDLFASK